MLSLTPHHTYPIIFISVHWSAVLFSFFTDHTMCQCHVMYSLVRLFTLISKVFEHVWMRYVCIDCNWQAMKCLRRKKLLDTRRAQHEQAIDKINTMLHMLKETESQKQVQALLVIELRIFGLASGFMLYLCRSFQHYCIWVWNAVMTTIVPVFVVIYFFLNYALSWPEMGTVNKKIDLVHH